MKINIIGKEWLLKVWMENYLKLNLPFLNYGKQGKYAGKAQILNKYNGNKK